MHERFVTVPSAYLMARAADYFPQMPACSVVSGRCRSLEIRAARKRKASARNRNSLGDRYPVVAPNNGDAREWTTRRPGKRKGKHESNTPRRRIMDVFHHIGITKSLTDRPEPLFFATGHPLPTADAHL
jgi:hypothetical protein